MTQTTENETTSEQSDEPRELYVIAAEIKEDWKPPYFGAVPYIRALACLTRLSDSYGDQDADEIVMYFLSNARTWRGETAKRIKAELREMIK